MINSCVLSYHSKGYKVSFVETQLPFTLTANTKMAASFVPNFDSLNCALCLKDMTDRTPRALECLHTFCECCLLKLPVTMVTQAHFLQCPTCKTFTRLPQEGVAGLKVNFILAEIGNQLKVQRMTLCEGCQISPWIVH